MFPTISSSFFKVGQFSPYREMTETQKPDQFNLFKGTENYQDEVICGNVNKYNENGVLSWRISPAEQIGEAIYHALL